MRAYKTARSVERLKIQRPHATFVHETCKLGYLEYQSIEGLFNVLLDLVDWRNCDPPFWISRWGKQHKVVAWPGHSCSKNR